MEEIKALGKTISIFILICVYGCSWGASLENYTFKNSIAIWKTILARMFIVIHICIALIFFIWCWIK